MGHLEVLAREPRPAGGVGAGRARAYCASVLRQGGFEVIERSFEFSAVPGALGAPIAGVFAIVALVAACLCGAGDRPGTALGIVGAGGVALVALGQWMGGRGVLEFPLMRRHAVNLEAARAGAVPRVWLVAHIDSKWQPVPMLARTGGVVLLVACAVVVTVAATTLLLPGTSGWIAPPRWHAMALASVASGLPVLLSFVGARNNGAVDNASGVAAVLSAASLLGQRSAVGIAITDAEELALAGAHAWCHGRAGGIALNCDSVDDRGALTVMTVGRRGKNVAARPGIGRQTAASANPLGPKAASVGTADLAELFRRAAREEGERLRVMRILPGVLTDSVAFAAAGWDTVTVSRGTLGTLWRIHTIRDDLGHLQGMGIDQVARMLVRVAEAAAGVPTPPCRTPGRSAPPQSPR